VTPPGGGGEGRRLHQFGQHRHQAGAYRGLVARDTLGNRGLAPGDRLEIDQPDLAFRLALEHADEIRVMHRVQRMVLERALVEGPAVDEEMAAIDRAARLREGRGDERDAAASRRDQRFRDRSDIAGIGRIEGRADLVEDMAGTAPAS